MSTLVSDPILEPTSSLDPTSSGMLQTEGDQSCFLNRSQSSARNQPQPSNWLSDFRPRRWLSNGHAQTLVGNFLPRPPFPLTGQADRVEVDAADGSRVLCHSHWQPEAVRAGRLTLLLLHGLEGSSDSRYIQGIATRAWAAGCNVVRMNMRNCGGTEALTPTLYHAGFSGDVHAVMRHYAVRFDLERVALVGYSMGGNLVMKLAAELGPTPPAYLRAVAAVSPATDLAASADALHKGFNRIYEWHFLRGLMARFRRKAALYPEIYSLPTPAGRIRSIREFDNNIVARYANFRDADDYYRRSSSGPIAGRIAVPTLVIHSLDDPFIRMMPETRAALLGNPQVTLVETEHGGHCAFLSDQPGQAIHWAEATLMRYVIAVAGHSLGS